MATAPAALDFEIDPETGLPDVFAGGVDDGSFDGAPADGVDGVDGAPADGAADGITAPDSPVAGGLDTTTGAALTDQNAGNPALNVDPTTGLPMDQASQEPMPYDAQTAQDLAMTTDAFSQQLTPAINNAQQQLTTAFGQPAITAGGKYVGVDSLTGNLVYANADGSPISTVAQQNPDGTYAFTPQGTQLMNATYPQDGGAGALSSINGALKAVSGLLGTPLGKLAGAGIVGALGLGAQALFGGNVTKAKPAQAPNTATINQLLATGQGQTLAGMNDAAATPGKGLEGAINQGLQGQSTLGSLANLQAQQQLAAQQQEQPVQQGIAMNALGTIPGLMNATTNPNIQGTAQVGQLANTQAQGLIPQGGSIAGGIGDQIQKVLAGNYSNPILENKMKLQQQEFQDRMSAQLGPDWQNTTTGMQQAEQQNLLEQSMRFQDQQQTIANYTPLFNQATSLQTGTGAQATGQVQSAQAQGLGQAAQISNLGQQNVGQITSSLAAVAPTTPLSGVASASQAAQQNLVNQQQTQMTNAATANQANQSLAAGIGSVTGAIAGGLAKSNTVAG
jgi:hypothetical protein